MRLALLAGVLFCVLFPGAATARQVERVDCSDRGCVTIAAAGKPRVHRSAKPVRTAQRKVRQRTAAVSHPVENPRTGPVRHVLGGRPSGCPRAWCGCWLARELGLADRSLWLARNWARFPRVGGPAPGVIAVWTHHVGQVVSVPQPGVIVLRSGNDGHAVRERPRSTRGVIAWVTVGHRYAMGWE